MIKKIDLPVNEILRLRYEDNYAFWTIADLYNVHVKTIRKLFPQDINFESCWKKSRPSKENLIKLYCKEKKSLVTISKELNVSRELLTKWYKDYGIEITSKKNSPLKEEIIRLNHEERKSLKEIAKIHGVGPTLISKWFKENGVNSKLPPSMFKIVLPSKEELIRLHYIENNSFQEIAKIYNVSDVLVGNWFKEYSIENISHKFISAGSKAENDIRDFLLEYDSKFEKKRFGRKELDIYHDDLKIGIEYNGLYWHSDEFLPRNYHKEKQDYFKKLGIQTFFIFEDEWIEKSEIIKSILLVKCGFSPNKVYARKCEVRMIKDKKIVDVFMNKNHLQGKPRSIKHSVGLFFKEELVAAMTFGLHHRNSKEIVLNRLAFKQNTSVIGGASKMFSFFMNTLEYNSILTWSDNRWSDGEIYKIMGFEKIRELSPDYSYIKKKKIFKNNP